MEQAARQYARKILALHLLALLLVIGAVVVMAAGMYGHSRRQAIEQAALRQELLAAETASGIEHYYRSILSNLDLIRRGEEEPATRPALAIRPGPRAPLFMVPLLWHQLDGRVSSLFAVRRNDDRVVASFPAQVSPKDAHAIAERHKSFIRSVEAEAISGFVRIGDAWGHLVCQTIPAPAAMESKLVLVAVVPIANIETRFLNALNSHGGTSVDAMLVDDRGLAMVAPDRGLIGADLRQGTTDPLVADILLAAEPRTAIAERPAIVAGRTIAPRILTPQRLSVGGKSWVLLISSPLADVDRILSDVYRHAILWAAILVAAMTVVLVSTSTQMIRSRLRAERARGEIIARELRQARQIQLAWLPQKPLDGGLIAVAAANEPASHISGDFYDWFELPDGRVVVTIGDVTGHGMAAAFLMATTQLLVRSTMLRLADAGRCLEEVNRHLCTCTQAFNGQFVTLLLLVLSAEGNHAEIASAGHLPPLLMAGGQPTPLRLSPGMVLGIDPAETYPTTHTALPDRFTLLLYTDGVIEATDAAGAQFGQTRLHELAQTHPASAESLVQNVVHSVRRFTRAELRDDLTVVAIQAHAAAVSQRL